MNRLRSTFREEDGLLDSFSYNFNGELIHPQYGLQPNGQGGFENPESVGSYVYDKAGNRLSVNGVIYEPNPLNQYTQAEGAPVGNGSQHEITSYQGVNYSYLADTRLANVQSNTGGVYQLGYDALGRTVRRTSNGQTSYIIYDGARSIIEYNAAGGMVANTVYGLGTDEIIARNNNGAGQFFLQDRMDNTVAVTGWKGELLEQYRYDAFGKPKIMGPGGEPLDETKINNNLLFNGREWISRFGFYENRARAYHPGLGRFMSEDPLGFAGGDNNLFRYCGNDPLNFSDPSGGPRTTKKRDGNDDSTAETERVVVTGHAPPDNTPNDRGFIDVNGIGGLDALNQGGGRGSSRGGSARLPRLARDSSWKGRVPNAPQSTQGMWTDMSGLPTGPNVYILTDERLLQVLNWVINEVNNAEARIDLFDIRWKNWMARFDTEFYKYGDSMFSYEGMFTNLNGTWSGFQVNYIGVGAAFAGHGVSHSDMADRVGWWNYDQYKLHFVSPEVQGKMDWAELGYDYYSGRW
jgi:RHS repeat-associated protein